MNEVRQSGFSLLEVLIALLLLSLISIAFVHSQLSALSATYETYSELEALIESQNQVECQWLPQVYISDPSDLNVCE